MANALFSSIPNEFEPLRKDLFSVIFPTEMNLSERFEVSASRPKMTNERKEVAYKQLTTYYKGKTKCEPMTIKFRDVIGPSVFQKILQWQRQHTDFISGCGGYASNYKKTLQLVMEDGCGNAVQKFILYGCFLTEVDGGELDQTSDDIAEVQITVSYDYFIQEL